MAMPPKRLLLAAATMGVCAAVGGYLEGGAGMLPAPIAGVAAGKHVAKLGTKGWETRQEATGCPLFEVESWHLQVPNPAPLAPTETLASRQIEATAQLSRKALPSLAALRQGQHILLPLHGAAVAALVTSAALDSDGWARVAGELQEDGKGSFFLSQKEQAFFGRIVQPGLGRAYRIATAPDGSVIIEQKPLPSVQCAAIPRKPRPKDLPVQAAVPLRSLMAIDPVPNLDSDPSAPNVIYIDFDGETVNDPDWNNGHAIVAAAPTINGSRLSTAQMTDIWNRVVEDYRPFKISITTILSRYTNAGPRHRMRCIVTPTDTAAPGAGGVAWTDSFRQSGIDFSTTVPCWAFAMDYYTTADISGIISHEVGHTMGLSHDGLQNPYAEYFEGQGSGPTSWAPIMGATYDHNVTQWSKGEYYRANNQEDDIAIIGGAANGFGFVADEDTPATPVTLPNDGVIALSGIISSQADVDQYVFATAGGLVRIDANPAPVEPDLDIKLEIRDLAGTLVLASSNFLNALNASISTTLPLGTYRVVVRGTGEGSPLGVGYSSYGSVGAYTLTGSYPTIPVAAPIITTPPMPAALVAGSKLTFSVVAASAVPPSYQWQKNGATLTGQTGSTLVFTSVQLANQGEYRCIVSNIAGSTPSDPASLTIYDKPAITKQPVATTVAAGSATPLTLSVMATDTPPSRYQWQHGTADLPGQTASTLTVANPQWTDGGSYRCLVSNDYGSVMSNAVLVTILAPPLFLSQPPTAKELPLGGASSIAVVAGGSPALAYQWYKGTDKVVGAVATTLSFPRITAAAAGTYHCVVTNKVGLATSDDCFVTVGLAPVITLQPLAQTVHEGNGFQLIVTATGSDTLAYRWQRDGVDVGTGPTFSVTTASWTDHGAYRCIVSTGAGTAISHTAVLTVQAGPIIVTPPASTKVAIVGKTTLKVVATGTPNLKYQWRKEGINVPGAVAASLVIIGTTSTSYDVVVSNPFNTAGVTSTAASVTAEAAPKIIQQPAAQTLALGAAASLTVQASGDGVLHYLWKKNGVPMGGQTAPALQLNNVSPTDAALYSVVVTNDVGTAASAAARLALLAPPKIVVLPVATTAKITSTITLTSAATGAATLKYHWQKDNADIIGATSPTLTIVGAKTTDTGLYRVVVSNAVDTAYSDPVPLTVVIPPAPTITSFTPPQGPAGSYIRLLGTGLDDTKGVTLQATKGGVVNAAFVIVSQEELLITVPAGAATSAITVVGIGGPGTSAGTFTVTPKQANDDFINAQVIPGTGGKVTGNNSSMTAEPGEPSHALDPTYSASDYLPACSAWYAWTPSTSGLYFVSTAGSAFDTRVAVYTGAAVDALSEVVSNDDASNVLTHVFRRLLASLTSLPWMVSMPPIRTAPSMTSAGPMFSRWGIRPECRPRRPDRPRAWRRLVARTEPRPGCPLMRRRNSALSLPTCASSTSCLPVLKGGGAGWFAGCRSNRCSACKSLPRRVP